MGNVTMLRCREISKLVSESMEHDLPLRTRMQVWMHLAMCRMCSGFSRQIRFLRRAIREHPERLGPDENAPVLITSNFSLSYFIVSGEIFLFGNPLRLQARSKK